MRQRQKRPRPQVGRVPQVGQTMVQWQGYGGQTYGQLPEGYYRGYDGVEYASYDPRLPAGKTGTTGDEWSFVGYDVEGRRVYRASNGTYYVSPSDGPTQYGYPYNLWLALSRRGGGASSRSSSGGGRS